jgi:hypothetical protein
VGTSRGGPGGLEPGQAGWRALLDGSPLTEADGFYPLAAYSEFMPAPRLGRTPLGALDLSLFSEDDPYGWRVSELEEQYELLPGIQHIGRQIMEHVVAFGKGLPEHHIPGHGGQNLKGNPYWPAELAQHAGRLAHERYVAFLPLMLSRTQDDKGRVKWTFFGGSIHGPERSFWKSFFSEPGAERPEEEAVSFIRLLLSRAYGERIGSAADLRKRGFRILPTESGAPLPRWTAPFIAADGSSFQAVSYLLTFRPFALLPPAVKARYLDGKIALLPFPGSLVFWGMPPYRRLEEQLPLAMQIPLQKLAGRSTGIGGLRATQSGWIHEPRPGRGGYSVDPELLLDAYHRTSRWDRVHRHQDELEQPPRLARVARVLFSTDPQVMGLYDKPMARNCQLWDHEFTLLLDGPRASRERIRQAESILLEGGLFEYRFFYPPMRVGNHDVYWHRPLVGFLPANGEEVQLLGEALPGYFTAYHRDDARCARPVELWPRVQERPLYLSALRDLAAPHDRYAHATSLNVLNLLEVWQAGGGKPLGGSFVRRLLDIPKRETLEQWLEALPARSAVPEMGLSIRSKLQQIIRDSSGDSGQRPITYGETAQRAFEEAWWDDIRFLANGEYRNKDNADVAQDEITQRFVRQTARDLGPLGSYLLDRHRKAIARAGMEGRALAGEQRFTWQTDFDFPVFGGWQDDLEGRSFERNILLLIPGRNRRQAVLLADHYDTAYMEDVYSKERGGTGARQSARGADDNCSATATLLQAAPIFLRLSREGRLERDIWLIHLTGEEFPSDCLGARSFCKALIEKRLRLLHDEGELPGGRASAGEGGTLDLSATEVAGLCVMDMIAHNRDDDRDVFQIAPGAGAGSLSLACQAHLAAELWNAGTVEWNRRPERLHCRRGKRSADGRIPETALHLPLQGEVRTRLDPRSSLYNTDGQIFSDVGLPTLLFMENYDINRSGYHDTKDTMENIDLDYGAALAAIAIETIARVATLGNADVVE